MAVGSGRAVPMGALDWGSGVLGKGMEAKEWGPGILFVFIPLPPFLCQIRFGNWGSDSGWPWRVGRTAVAADRRRIRASKRRSMGFWLPKNGGSTLAGGGPPTVADPRTGKLGGECRALLGHLRGGCPSRAMLGAPVPGRGTPSGSPHRVPLCVSANLCGVLCRAAPGSEAAKITPQRSEGTQRGAAAISGRPAILPKHGILRGAVFSARPRRVVYLIAAEFEKRSRSESKSEPENHYGKRAYLDRGAVGLPESVGW